MSYRYDDVFLIFLGLDYFCLIFFKGLHHGLGRGCGAVIGGLFVNSFGSTATFRGYGCFCILVLAVFIFINFYRKEEGFVSDIPQTEDPRQVNKHTLSSKSKD